jgi:predicted dienelactone hydrolase
VFSHGNGGVRMQSTYLLTALASHGYVVAAPDHTGSTLRDINDPSDLSVGAVLNSYLVRPVDLSFVIDHFAHAGPKDPFFDAIDLNAIGAIGHSLGSISALRSAGLDSRIRVAIAQTPASHLAT